MTGLSEDFAVVTRYIRNLRGGSQPILAEASDGLLYVIKFRNNLQGPNLTFNEAMGAELYRACGFPVAPWKPLLVSDAFLDQNPACWLQTPEGALRPASGVCFGSCFLGGDGVRLFEILPGSYFQRVQNRRDFWVSWLVDICAQHADNRQAIFEEGITGKLNAVFIDHGHMFGGPKGDQNPHFKASRCLDARIYDDKAASFVLTRAELGDKLRVERLWDQVQTLPIEWKVNSAVGNFARCLDRLSDSRFTQRVWDTMIGSQLQANTRKNFSRYEPALPSSILRYGVRCDGKQGNALR